MTQAEEAGFGVPVIEDGSVIFTWEGDDPPEVIGDFNGWGAQSRLRFSRRGWGMWQAETELESSAYIEYAFARGDDRFPDPRNPRRIPNGIGHVNSYFAMPEWRESAALGRRRGVAKGTITRHELRDPFRMIGGKRDVWLYEPAASGPARLLVVFDGQDYLRRGRLPVVLDNLIAQEEISPVVALLVAHGNGARPVEYACNGATAELIHEVAIPFARETSRFSLDERVVTIGASMGGLMALYTAASFPETINGVISQSGAFKVGYGYSVFRGLLTDGQQLDFRVHMSVGKYDFLLDGNRDLRDRLRSRNYDLKYTEYAGGHNYTSWRNELATALSHLFAH